jgi:hypothetical protein
MKTHKSDSSEQQSAESFMLDALAKDLCLSFDPEKRLPLSIGVQPDAVDPTNKVVVEVYARIGTLKGGQLHKVKGDILKLIFIDEKLGGGWRKILVFADELATNYVLGTSWVAEAVRSFGIEVFVRELPKEQELLVKAAQVRQRMVNP